MADTQTTNILLTDQTEGGNSNSWGTIVDTNFWLLDAKFGDITTISTTGGSTTLTDTQELVNVIVVSGSLVSNADIVFSGRGGSWTVKNATTGQYSVTCKVTGQDGVIIPQGARQVVFCNAADIETGSSPSNATETPTGSIQPYVGTASPQGWVRANGRTIGNGASGGTERANSDTETLFSLLWNSYTNSILAVQDSSGTPTTRGGSAAADYAANRRLPLPDFRGRSLFGLDDMGNSAAGRLGSVISSPTTNGASGGSETVALTTAQMPSHTHTGPSHTHSVSGTTGTESADHTHSVSGSTGSSGAHTHTVTDAYIPNSGDGTTGGGSISQNQATTTRTTSSNGAHTHSFSTTSGGRSATHTHSFSVTTGSSGTGNTGSSGSGNAHSNMPPAWLITFLIKL